MTQTTAPKLTAADKRFAFLREVTAPLENRAKARLTLQQSGLDPEMIPDLDVDQLTEIAVAMSQGKHLGRTDRWKNTCHFAETEIDAAKTRGDLDQSFARWAVVQGSVWMAYAAD